MTTLAEARRRWSRTVLLAVLLVIGVWALFGVYSASKPIAEKRAALTTPDSPRAIVSLELASSPAVAQRIIGAWTKTPGGRRALTVTMEADTRLIYAYTLAFLAFLLWSCLLVRVSPWVVALAMATVVIAGLSDLAENWFLAFQIDTWAPSGFPIAGDMPFHVVADVLDRARVSLLLPHGWRPTPESANVLGRTAAMVKFVLLSVAGFAFVVFSGGGWRAHRGSGARLAEGTRAGAFPVLISRENACIFTDTTMRPDDGPQFADDFNATDEPRVAFRAADLIGLALSGGGIRSATFNLGLLAGLHRRNLLGLIDYLSTVSGGGYVGAFWSSWLRTRKPGADIFPTSRGQGAVSQGVDQSGERHLREFSGFLVPRVGLFLVDTWTAGMAVVAGLLPAFAIGSAVLSIVVLLWLLLSSPLAYGSARGRLLVIGGLTALLLAAFEYTWQRLKVQSASGDADSNRTYGLFAGLAVLLTTWVESLLPVPWTTALWTAERTLFGDRVVVLPTALLTASDGVHRSPFEWWWILTGIDRASLTVYDHWYVLSPRLFDFTIPWIVTAAILIVIRLGWSVRDRVTYPTARTALDRVLVRIAGFALAWALLALLWHIAINLGSAWTQATAALVSAGLFAGLRNWFAIAFAKPSASTWRDRLKPYVPQALAYLTLVLMVSAIGALMVQHAGIDWFAWWRIGTVALAVVAVGLFLNPGEFGLHAFYRDRLNRAYLGAHRSAAEENRASEPRATDDYRLNDLPTRPLHLVCCAVNDLSGDPVATLSRGARSGVLSRHGFSIGNRWVAMPDLTIGAAVTASAAAFNSNMGQISIRLGPAVSFLMTMLNLRLGLWLRDPRATLAGRRRWPGLLLYREMVGLLHASGPIAPNDTLPLLRRDVHLSDGGHFENLALYELVRRHCRYIIVSDAGADPETAFDDLGVALRRIREDFGVDIVLDVEPLRPDAHGRSRQHVAVGTICYSDIDRGVLIYIKPTLTGDEPPDVLQYQTRNRAFPHESTGDQFYDEAQWESYRRLGLHVAEEVFSFVLPWTGADSKPPTADAVFTDARHVWGATPPDLVANILQMTGRFAELEAELQQRAARGVLAEVFPEIAVMRHGGKPALPAEANKATKTTAKKAAKQELTSGDANAATADTELATDLSYLLRVTQLMEDVWMSCQLERWWQHPLNLGWINLFARWATAPSFRRWWPVFAPMCSPGFRSFIEERFAVRGSTGTPEVTIAPFTWSPAGGTDDQGRPLSIGLAELWWTQRSNDEPTKREGREWHQGTLKMPAAGDQPDFQMQVALVGVFHTATTGSDSAIGWHSDDYFVPPSLWGAGIGATFLSRLLTRFEDYGYYYVVVNGLKDGKATAVARQDRRSFIDQYRRIGFRQVQLREAKLKDFVIDTMKYDETGDVLFEMPSAVRARRKAQHSE